MKPKRNDKKNLVSRDILGATLWNRSHDRVGGRGAWSGGADGHPCGTATCCWSMPRTVEKPSLR